MRILLANKFYYRRGGDCVYMLNLEQMFKAHGHEVAVFAMDYPENLDTLWKEYFPSNMSKVMAFTRPFGSKEVKRKFTALLDDFKPEVVHLNNVHTQLSPVMAELAHKRGVRVVWTLHDYKLLCPRYDCLRVGEEERTKNEESLSNCELCFNGSKKQCFDYKCMKGSRLASLIGWREAVTWNRERLEACTDVFICPSQFMADKMMLGGFSEKKMKTLCNFIDVEKCVKDSYEKEDYYCFIGRLSHEKGIKTLIEAAKKLPYKLVVIGGGPLLEKLKETASENIEFVGFKQWNEIKELVGRARFSVIPSEWYENNPLSVIEALCLGTPVLGSKMGGIPELTQYIFNSGEVANLKDQIEKMWKTQFDYKEIASESMKKYNSESYYENIMKLYENV